MKLILLSLFYLSVSGANLAPRQQRGPPGGWGGGRGKGRPTGGNVIFTPIVTTTARTTARTTTTIVRTTARTTSSARTTARITTVVTTIRTSTTARPAAPVCEWTGHCIGDACQVDEDCDLDYFCSNRRCAAPAGTVPAPTSTARVTTTARPGTTASTVRTGASGARTTTVFVTAPRPTSTARGGQAPAPSVAVPPVDPGRKCDNPFACIGLSCRTDADCQYELIICTNGVCGL
ncbi:hypothetical protein B0T14DRAFT_595376 [Immersiella caudata]|uniref:Uncharacterized protein n=1 Tax=Immersiella caudata TaxID=314043 RepID=A0AA39U6G0_9PEZI|nr:hypothetical protein B0T14DRAFT_595376 [Immersiella caudata]